MKLYVFPLLSLLAACSAVPHKYMPRESPGTKVVMEKGKGFSAISNGKVVLLPILSDQGDEIEAKVLINNLTDSQLVFKDSEFSLSSSDDQVTWKPLKVYDSQEYFSKAREDAESENKKTEFWATVLAIQSAKGRSNSYGNYSANVNGNSVSGSYQGTTEYYDPVAAQVAWDRADQAVNATKNKNSNRLSDLEKHLMYEERIQPNAIGGGLVFFKRKESRFYRLDINNPTVIGVSLLFERVKN